MSNIIPNWVPYFQLPQAFVTEGYNWQLSRIALALHDYLYYKAQRFSNATVRVMSDEVRLAPATLRRARRELVKADLIRLNRGLGGVYEYMLCDPKTKEPLRRPDHSIRHEKHEKAGLPRTRRAGDLREVVDGLTAEAKMRFYQSRVKPDRWASDGYMARCPFHDDAEASLHISGDGVWFCHGCERGGGLVDFEQQLSRTTRRKAACAIVQECAPSTPLNTTAEAIYNYTDENGGVLSQVFRYHGKKFKQGYVNGDGRRIWNTRGVRNVPYRLHELLAARDVFVVEGEKDAERLSEALANLQPPAAATTCRNGAGSWPVEFGPYFQDKHVVVLPDNDDAGLRHARAVVESVKPYATAVKTVLLPELKDGGDVSDYLDAHSFDEFVSEVLNVEWETSR